MSEVTKACVIGGGAFGTAMANHLGMKGIDVKVWVREEGPATDINEEHENKTYLAGCPLCEKVVATNSIDEAVNGAELILLVIPTPFIGSWINENQKKLPTGVPLICCSKGIENSTLRTPYEILIDELPGKFHRMVCVISGPSFAKEVVVGLPTNVTCAALDESVAKMVQNAVSTRNFRVYTATDVIGAELCGAVKNVLAIASGASDGLGFGSDARAALITRGLVEMARLVVKKGGRSSTIMGLAGVGDLVLTCTGTLSRNYTVGFQLGSGRERNTGAAVAEGVKTSLSIHALSEQLGVDMPICNAVYKVIHEEKNLMAALAELQDRPLGSEDDIFAEMKAVEGP